MSEEDQIRRLLADARHDEPIPPDVAGRLDGVLADLRADRPVRPTVTDLDAARRRRRARVMLVAAAAVVVVGIGVNQVRGHGIGSEASSDDSGGGAAAQSQVRSGASGELAAPSPPSNSLDLARGQAVRISSDRFAQRARQLQAVRRSSASGSAGSAAGAQADTPHPASGQYFYDLQKTVRCRAPGRGRAVPVRYDGAPGLLVYRPPSGDSQVVDLILCGHSGIVRTITLPAP